MAGATADTLATGGQAKRRADTLSCPNCGSPVQLRAPGHTVSVVCGSCASVLDARLPTLTILNEAAKKQNITPLIPLGTRGTLQNVEWEVIGFMQRTAADVNYKWREYLLYNPYHGFVWLTEENGHWNFVRTQNMLAVPGPSSARMGSESFSIFQTGKGKVQYVLGEFYWRVKVGYEVNTADYILPPLVLSQERDGTEVGWSVGTYTEPAEVASAFGIKEMPPRKGVYLNQPSPYGASKRWTRITYVATAVALVVLQIFTASTASEKVVFEKQLRFSGVDTTTHSFISDPIKIEDGKETNLEVQLATDVSNSWIAFDADLLNETTGDQFAIPLGASYYYGRDSDSDWSEGSRTNDVLLNDISPGTYRLNVEVPKGNWDDKLYTANCQFRVVRDVPVYANFFFALLILAVLVIAYELFVRSFEVKRWSESDYSPYVSSDDDDDD